MRAIQHVSNNAVLVGEGSVSPLPVTRVVYEHPYDNTQNMNGLISYWKPSMEELRALAAGKPVRLEFLGQTHPPVKVGVDGVE